MMRRLVVPALAALGFIAGVSGCGRDNRGSVAFTALCFPPTPDATTGSCPLDASCAAVLANGSLFVDLATSGFTLEYPIQLDNERTDNTDTETGRTNTNFAIIERFDMKYEAAGLNLPSGFSLQTINVPAAGTTVAEVQLIPVPVGTAIAAALPAGQTNVVIKVKAHGRYGDDTQFDTAPFAVPVAVSNGLIGPAGCADSTKTLVGVCPQQGQTNVVLCQ